MSFWTQTEIEPTWSIAYRKEFSGCWMKFDQFAKSS